MKKFAGYLLAALFSLGFFTTATQAANDVVMRGTPVVDGVVDEIYKDSLTIVYDGNPEINAFKKSDWKGDTMTAYALYDDDYLYMVADVKDDDVVSADKNWVETEFNPYCNDVVEFRFNYYGGRGVQFKIGVDAFGYRAYTIQPEAIDLETVIYKTNITEDGYVVEIAVPTTVADGACFLTKGKIGIKMWVFDLQASAEGKVAPIELEDVLEYSISYGTKEDKRDHGAPVVYQLGGEIGETPAVAETAAPETAAPETAAPETAAPETTAPETAAPETTAPETAASETPVPETAAPTEQTPTTSSPATEETPTDTTEDKSNPTVPIIIAAAAVVVIAAAGVIIAKKKK